MLHVSAPIGQSRAPRGQHVSPPAWYFCLRSVRALWTDYAPNQALRFLLRALLWPRVTSRWSRFLARVDLGSTDWAIAAGLLEKPHRPYINIHWTRLQRLSALVCHYETITRLPERNLLRRAHATGYVLVVLRLPDGDYRLRLRGCCDSREGELELALETVGERRVVMILFSFTRPFPAVTAAIGCLQGGTADAHQDVVAVSKAFYGVPVKLLITRLLRDLLLDLVPDGHIEHLIAVDDESHVFQHRHYRRKHKVSASYSATWSALGGQRCNDGFWELPLIESPPDYPALKSSKRSAARHRWQAFQSLCGAMKASLATHEPQVWTLPGGEQG